MPAPQERFKEINEAYQVLSDPAAPPDATTCSARPGSGGDGGGRLRRVGFGVVQRHLRRVLRWRRGRRPRDAATRGRAPTSATTSGSPSRRRSTGPRRRSSSRSTGRCETCDGNGAKPGTEPIDLPTTAAAAARSGRPAGRCSARWSTSRPARAARARARSSRTPCETCHGEGRTRAQADAPGHDPGRDRRGPPDPAVERGRGRARAAGLPARLYVAVHVAPHPTLRREGTELFYEADVSIAQAALGTTISVPTVDGDEEVEVKAGHPARDGDPPPRPRRAPPPPDRLEGRSPRVRERRRAGEAVEAPARAARRVRRGGAARRSAPASRDPRQGPRRARLGRRLRPARRRAGRRRLARALGRGRPRGRRGGLRDPGPGRAGRDERRARVRARRRGPRRTVDPTRPAIVRAYVPARDPAAVERAVAEAPTALGHLQAFGLRPIGELTTRLVHEADWAEAWKAYFPVLRVGRRLVIRPTWRRHRPEPGDVVLALDPGWRSGPASIRRRGSASRRSRPSPTAGRLDGARVLDVGCGSGILAIAAARLGRGDASSASTPIRSRSRRPTANARRNRLARRLARPRGQPADAASRRSTSSSRTSSRRCWSPWRRRSRDELRAGRHARSRRGSSSTARTTCARRSRPPGSAVATGRARATGSPSTALRAARV